MTIPNNPGRKLSPVVDYAAPGRDLIADMKSWLDEIFNGKKMPVASGDGGFIIHGKDLR